MPRIAKALDTLRAQVQKEFPKAPKSEFGWIGDTAHSNRKSDHNPNKAGHVLALDIPHRPEIGLDAHVLADYMIAHPDKRARYIISNARIAGNAAFIKGNPKYRCPGPWQWGRFRGANLHRHHMHISAARPQELYDDASRWDLGFEVKKVKDG
jgi:hypothetical protein